MSGPTSEWRWEAQSPPSTSREGLDLTARPQWIAEIWRLRGLVLYDEGRRPQFLQADGQVADRDPLDLLAYHVLGWCDGVLAGCIRFVPTASPLPSLTEQVLGCERFEQVLASLQTTRLATVDVGRWIVHPDYRHFRVALSLVGACWSYVQCLGFQMAVATVGTRAGQDVILQRAGLSPVPGVGAHVCEAYDDELRTMYAIVREPAPNFSGVVQQMEARLIASPTEALSMGYSKSA